MRIDLLAVGRLKAGPEQNLFARYAERFTSCSRAIGLSGPRLVEIPESQQRRDADRKAEEGRALLASFDPVAFLCVLDERGKLMGSTDFAGRIATERDGGRQGVHDRDRRCGRA